MTDLEKASREAAKTLRNETHRSLYVNGFEAGAAWQRERDAEIAEAEGRGCEGIQTDWQETCARISNKIRPQTFDGANDE